MNEKFATALLPLRHLEYDLLDGTPWEILCKQNNQKMLRCLNFSNRLGIPVVTPEEYFYSYVLSLNVG